MLRSPRITERHDGRSWHRWLESGDPCKIKMMTISRLHDSSNPASHVCQSPGVQFKDG